MKLNIIHKLIPFLIPVFIITGCSSSKETATDKSKLEKEERKPAIIPNEESERVMVRSEKIKSIDKISFDYDENGKPVNGEKLSTVNYSPDGLMNETIIYGKNSQVDNIYKYNYDRNNYRTQTIRYTSDNKPDKKYLYEYNKYGNKIKSVRNDLNGKMEKYYTYKYDGDQKLTEENWFDAVGKSEYSIKYEYNDNGDKKSATTYNSNGEMLYRYEYRYGPKGKILEEKKFDEDDKPVGVIQYVYKYFGSGFN